MTRPCSPAAVSAVVPGAGLVAVLTCGLSLGGGSGRREDGVEQVGGVGVGGGVGGPHGVPHLLHGLGAHGGDVLLAQQAELAHPVLEPDDRVLVPPLGDLLLGAVQVLVGLAVALPAVGDVLDERRPLAGAGAVHGGLPCVVHLLDVVAVDGDAGDAV